MSEIIPGCFCHSMSPGTLVSIGLAPAHRSVDLSIIIVGVLGVAPGPSGVSSAPASWVWVNFINSSPRSGTNASSAPAFGLMSLREVYSGGPSGGTSHIPPVMWPIGCCVLIVRTVAGTRAMASAVSAVACMTSSRCWRLDVVW